MLCPMQIIDLTPAHAHALEDAAALLVEGFATHWPAAWPDLESARAEVRAWLGPEHLCRAAVDPQGRVLGWIAGHAQYDGHVWELHPLVVRADRRGAGLGRRLVADLEAHVAQRGGLTLLVGSDDEDQLTSLGGIDLYPHVWEHIAHIRNLHGHPYGFYERCGFTIVGVVPDANGLGKPDILLAKRVGGAAGPASGAGASLG